MAHPSSTSPATSSPAPAANGGTAASPNQSKPTTMSATETSTSAKSAAATTRPGSTSEPASHTATAAAAASSSNGSRRRSAGAHAEGKSAASGKTNGTAFAAESGGDVVRLTAVQNVNGSGTSNGISSSGAADAGAAATAGGGGASPDRRGGSASASTSATGDGNEGQNNASASATTGRPVPLPYPAPSVGLPAPSAVAMTLLNLEVKVLTQALGAENQWVEQGDGRVSFCDFTIRVTAPSSGKDESLKEKASSGRSAATQDGPGGSSVAGKSSALDNTVSDLDEDDEDEVIILEDTISNDTPFVGENCCIVWNSFEKQLSLCLMYASEEGYSASWSALVALQDKSYPPFRYDLLERCRPLSERTGASSSAVAGPVPGDSESSVATPAAGSTTEKVDDTVLPYAYFIHDRHNPPLGFIEQHALSLSIMEHHHASNPALYANKDTVVAMLSVANADLLDHLITDQVFPLLLSGLRCSAESAEWVVPAQLRDLHVPPDVTAAIAKDRRITFLQESVLSTCCAGETRTDLMTKYSTLSRRIRNDIVCGLLTCDALFAEASEALRIAPPVVANNTNSSNAPLSSPASAATGAMVRSRIGSMDSSSNTSSVSLSSGFSPIATPLTTETMTQAQKAEQQVLAHLRFFRELVTLSISELGREMVGPIVGKVYQCGLLYSLSLVAERFAMPSNVAAVFVKRLTDSTPGTLNANRRANTAAPMSSTGGHNSTNSAGSGANYYSAAVEQELAAVLDVTLVRINERQEEQLMNDHVRSPILADPLKYNGLVTFMVRQLITNGVSSVWQSSGAVSGNAGPANRAPGSGMLPQPKRIMRDNMSASNPFALFHVLGLHDDEGSAASERVLDAESTSVRNQFHSFIITKYLAHATRGIMPPVPLPPSLGGVAARNAPIVRFDNAAAVQNGSARVAHHDGGEASTSASLIGIPNTGVGVGATSGGGGGGGTLSGGGVNGGRGGASSSPVLPLPQGVTPALIRVLEYLIALASRANRELVLKTVFHPKSHILHFIEGACDTLCNADGMGGRCQVGLDVLCGCVRFLKVVIAQMALPSAEQDDNPLPSYTNAPEPLSSGQITAICRQLTVERDTFGYLLKAYNKLGGVRRNTVFHSSLLAVLDIIGKCPSKEPEDKATNNLRDVRDYLFYRHLTRLPEVFARRFREELLDEVGARLGREALHSPNDSVSVLSSTTGSELLRSSSKLRFVDEVEAVAGGVDGTVVPGTVMSPAIMANMANVEEKQRKRNARTSLDQWTATATHVMSSPSQVRAVTPLTLSDESPVRNPAATSPPPPAAASRASPPMTISITRPAGTSISSPHVAPLDGGKATAAAARASSASASTSNGDAKAAVPAEAVNGGEKSDNAQTSATAENGASATSSASSSANTSVNTGSAANGGAVLKPTAPKNEKPPGRPRNFSSVLETTVKNGESAGGKSRSMPNVTTGALTPPSSPEEARLSKSGSITATAPLARSNSSGESGVTAAINGSPSSSMDNVVLPKIKKRASASGKRA